MNGWIPLTRHLEQAFASRLPGLPALTLTALLAAGLDDGDGLGEVLAAASLAAGAPVSMADLAPAVAAGLAEVDGQRVRFRHPLMRSAVCEAAGPARRQVMHRALAQVLAGMPDRQVWHRAAASLGPDEEVAAGLEAAADQAGRRGAAAERAAALAQAARLSPGSARRGQRLLRAAWAFYDLGRLPMTRRLLEEAEPLDLEPGDRLRLSWARETMGAATRSGTRPLAAFAGLAGQMRQDGDTDQALRTLQDVALRCWWSNPDRATRQQMTAVAQALPVAADDPRLLHVLALSDPAGHGAAVLARLGQHQPGSGTAIQDYLLGYAAAAVGACEQAVGFLTAAAPRLRARGRLGTLGQVLLSQGWSALLLGHAGLAGPAADEAARLLAESGRPLWAACAQLAQAVLAGRRGDTAAAELTARAEPVLLMGGPAPAAGPGPARPRHRRARRRPLRRGLRAAGPDLRPPRRRLPPAPAGLGPGRPGRGRRRLPGHRPPPLRRAHLRAHPPGGRGRLAPAARRPGRGRTDAGHRRRRAGTVRRRLRRRPDGLAAAPRPAAARLRHVAAPPPAGRRVPRAAAHRPRHLRRARRRRLGRPRPPGAARRRRAQRPARPPGTGPARPPRTANRAASRRRAQQPVAALAPTCTGSSPSSASPHAPNWQPSWAPPQPRRKPPGPGGCPAFLVAAFGPCAAILPRARKHTIGGMLRRVSAGGRDETANASAEPGGMEHVGRLSWQIRCSKAHAAHPH